jgi:hypothetical protein
MALIKYLHSTDGWWRVVSCQILFHYRLQWATMVLQDLRLVKRFSEPI